MGIFYISPKVCNMCLGTFAGGGDGQAGDDGEGTGGTDRNNVCPMPSNDRGGNFPLLFETMNMFTDCTVHWTASTLKHPEYQLNAVDVFLQHASSGNLATPGPLFIVWLKTRVVVG